MTYENPGEDDPLSTHRSLGMNCVSLLLGGFKCYRDAQKDLGTAENTKAALAGVDHPSFFLNTSSDPKINI